MILFSSERFAHHLTPPGHPERPERATALRAVARRWASRGHQLQEPEPATMEALERVHTTEYLRMLRGTAGRAVRLDPDTTTSPESYDVACLAAGAALGAVDAVLHGPETLAAALVRPPGHHAEPDRAMGFCLLNNVAIAAAHARAQGVARVAIVDVDVHHGNGTQTAFYDDPAVLFISSHQFPYYPGSGAATEIGRGAGLGFTVNLPVEAGAGDADLDEAYSRVVLPVLDAFRPELLLVSAGFDAHAADPLGGLRMTAGGFARLAGHVVAVADRHARGRIVVVTEGGYDIDGLTTSLDATLGVLTRRDAQSAPPGGDRRRGTVTAAAASKALGARWSLW